MNTDCLKEIYNIDKLKKSCEMIHFFGLGFIQLKLSKETRLHFYTEVLPPIVPEEDIHNHRYNFTSLILKGSLQQDLFGLTDGDTHIIEEESCKEGHCAAPGKLCGIEMTSYHIYEVGSEYQLSHTALHRVIGYECITRITRGGYKKELAQVVRPVNAPKVCPFSKKIEEIELWEIVDCMIKA